MKKQMKKSEGGKEIVALILDDHKPLKELLKTLKDPEISFAKRKKAFEAFAPTLTIHAKAEEQALYTKLKDEEELRVEGLEGDTEHAIADQLVHEIKAISDEYEWTAKAKVLAELVEHHIEEEESDMLKEVKKEFSLEDRKLFGEEYLERKDRIAVEIGASKYSTKAA